MIIGPIIVSRFLVGGLLIVSGVIKANDAIGFSYKLDEYFTEGVLGFEFLQPYTLLLAGFICVLEIVLGVALIFGLKAKLTTSLNLLMMLFFTFLTFYSAYFNKVTDCGCFGDALKLTPWQSFWKDVVLLFLSLPLFIYRNGIKPIPNSQFISHSLCALLVISILSVFVIGWWFPVLFSIIVFTLMFLIKRFDTNDWRLLSVSLIASILFTVYCFNNLPIKDFRPYAVEKNIGKGMQVPEDALPEIVEYQWEFLVDGKKKIFVTDGAYPNVPNGEFTKNVTTKVVREAEEPPIHDFTIELDVDETDYFLSQDNVLVVVAYDLSKSDVEGFKQMKIKTDEALKKGYKVIGMTAGTQPERAAIINEYGLNFQFYFCDGTTLKTIVRSNPGIFEMDKGTIMQKLHWSNIKDLKL